MTPARWSAAATQALFGNPFNPLTYTLPGRMLNASADVFAGVTRRRGKPAWNVPASLETIDERPFGRLVHFARGDGGRRPRALLVAPLSGHHATLLRNTVEVMIENHDVYVTDWVDARDVPLGSGRFDLEDYIAYVIDYIRLLGPDVHVVAVCQPAPAGLAAIALLAADNDRKAKHTSKIKGRAPSAAAHHGGGAPHAAGSSTGFKSGGSAYDPLNGKL